MLRSEPVKSLGHREPIKMPPRRFCKICNVRQPYRSRHCHECGQCVRKFDHHCFWIGGCVGELNHGRFWLFLFFQTWLQMVCFGIAQNGHSLTHEVYGDESMVRHVQTIWMSFMVVCFLFVLFTGILGSYHLYLLVSG